MRHLRILYCALVWAFIATSFSLAWSDTVFFQDAKGKKKAKDDPNKKDSNEPAGSPGRALEAWGTLKEVKGTPFFTIDYTKVEARKATKHSAFVKLAEGAEVFTDKSIKITDLKEGDPIWLLGRSVENETPGKDGVPGGTDRQMQNVLAIVKGEGVRVNTKYRDSKDPNVRWHSATVAKEGPSINVKYEGQSYKVALGKTAPILAREKAADPKLVKSGVQVEVSGDKIDEKPETKSASDAKKESFGVKKVAILDRRLASTLYPMMLE